MSLARMASLGLLALAACSSTPKERPSRSPLQHRSQHAPPDSYGFTPDNPIRVGGGPDGQHAFLEALRGPEGQPIAWRRLGSCCEFETPNGLMGFGLLDMYEVHYEGLERPVILYLDMYDAEPVAAPVGFTLPGAEEQEEEAPPQKPRVIEL
jgi:hypothetical protein